MRIAALVLNFGRGGVCCDDMVCFVGVERVFVRWTRTVSTAMLLATRMLADDALIVNCSQGVSQ